MTCNGVRMHFPRVKFSIIIDIQIRVATCCPERLQELKKGNYSIIIELEPQMLKVC